MRRLFQTIGLSTLSLMLLSGTNEASPIVSIEPSVSSVNVGDVFEVSVAVTDITDLYGFQFDVAFDPGLLQATGVTEGAFMSDWGATLDPVAFTFWDPGIIDNGAGNISFVFNLLLGSLLPGDGATGSGTLAVLEFQVLAAGSGSVSLLNGSFVDSILDPIDVEFVGGRVDVEGTAVAPEPATFLLLVSGVVLYMRSRRGQ